MNKAFFVDKDGTLVDNSGYPEIIPSDGLLENDVVEGLKYLQKKEYKIILISNQPWIAKGRMSIEEVEQVFQSLILKLSSFGVKIEDYYYCPHQTSDNCNCKKPKPQLIKDAANKHNINLNNSFMIGDMEDDILTGKNAGIKTILVLTGNGRKYKENNNADYTIKNINEVINII